MRKYIFSFLIFLFLSSTASAFSDDIERYPINYTDKWALYCTETTNGGISVETLADNRQPSNTVLSLTVWAKRLSGGGQTENYGYLIPYEESSPTYFSFIVTSLNIPSFNDISGVTAKVIRPSDGATIAQFSSVGYSTNYPDTKYEIIQSGSYYNLYRNGTLLQSVVNQIPSYTGNVYYCPGAYIKAYNYGTFSSTIRYDDLTDSSIIGTAETINEGNDHFNFTWSAQLMRNYAGSDFSITLYSLSNQNNTGELYTWKIPQSDNTSTPEHGYFSLLRNSILGESYGLYLLEMSRGSVVLSDTYFYYYQLANPQSLPEILYIGESNVNTEIRDEDNNGGEILGGDSVYLYPAKNENGIYNISYKILETPYSITLELTKVYNTTALYETNIIISGLSGQNYNIKLNGDSKGRNEGADTFTLSISDFAPLTQIITIEPDYTLPGVWGYIKNEETQTPLKSATVTITNGTYTEYLYTDTNGMFYKTAGIIEGSYNVSAAKTGYTTSNIYQITTAAGATSRQDIFLAKSSGAGVYYAPHDVIFHVKENYYSDTLTGVGYNVSDTEDVIKTGYTDSEGSFTVAEMSPDTNYTIILSYQGTNYTKYIEPGLSEYTLYLTEGSAIHTYVNNWLTLTYTETGGNVTVNYISNKTVSGATLTATAGDGSTFYTETLTNTSGSFNTNLSTGTDFNILFTIEATDGSKASQAWTYTAAPTVNLFPSSYPDWLKNILFGGVIIVFMLSFGKSKNDLACGVAAMLCSLGYYFGWLICSFNFVVLIWIIAAGAIFLHYKRTGHLG